MVAGVYPKHDNPLIIFMEALALHSVQPGTGMLQITCMHHTRAWAQVGFTACWLQIDFVYSVYYLSIKCGEWKLENYIENRSKNLFFAFFAAIVRFRECCNAGRMQLFWTYDFLIQVQLTIFLNFTVNMSNHLYMSQHQCIVHKISFKWCPPVRA